MVDGVVGDYLCRKYGDMRETPLTIEIGDNRIVDLECANQELLEEFRAYTEHRRKQQPRRRVRGRHQHRVHDVIGNILQDEKIPGIHIAFGHPYAEHTGPTGFQRPTSTASAATSTSGSTASR